MKTKDEWRRMIRIQRAGLTLEQINEWSKAAIRHLREWATFQQAQRIACYMAKPFEVQTQSFIEQCLTKGKQVCVPRHIDGKSGYEWSWVEPAGAWRDGPFRIAEPAHYNPVKIKEIELAIVPVVAVDTAGHRLGAGGGNFDRLLARMECPRAGLAFAFQVVEAIPMEAHDVPVNAIITQTGLHACEAAAESI